MISGLHNYNPAMLTANLTYLTDGSLQSLAYSI